MHKNCITLYWTTTDLNSRQIKRLLENIHDRHRLLFFLFEQYETRIVILCNVYTLYAGMLYNLYSILWSFIDLALLNVCLLKQYLNYEIQFHLLRRFKKNSLLAKVWTTLFSYST